MRPTKHHLPNFRVGKSKGTSPDDRSTVAPKVRKAISTEELTRSISQKSEKHQAESYKEFFKLRNPRTAVELQQAMEQLLFDEFGKYLLENLSNDKVRKYLGEAGRKMGFIPEYEQRAAFLRFFDQFKSEQEPDDRKQKSEKSDNLAEISEANMEAAAADFAATSTTSSSTESATSESPDIKSDNKSEEPEAPELRLTERKEADATKQELIDREKLKKEIIQEFGQKASKVMAATVFAMGTAAAIYGDVNAAQNVALAAANAFGKFAAQAPFTMAAMAAQGGRLQTGNAAVTLFADTIANAAATAAEKVAKKKKGSNAKKKKGPNIREDAEFMRFWDDCGSGRVEQVKERLAQTAEENLDSLLTSVDPNNKATPLFIASNNKKLEVVRVLCGATKKPKVLKKMFTQVATIGEIPLFSEEVAIIREIFTATGSYFDILEQMITLLDSTGCSRLLIAIGFREEEVVDALLELFDNPQLIEAKPQLVDTTLSQVDPTGTSALYGATKDGLDSIAEKILARAKNKPPLVRYLISQKPRDIQELCIINHLVMANNHKAIAHILPASPNITTEKLPTVYYSEVPQTSIYYLEAFLNFDDSGSKLKKHESAKDVTVKYFQLQNGELRPVKINDIKFGEPIVIEISKASAKPRKVILADDVVLFKKREKEIQDLKKAFELANGDPKVDEIITNVSLVIPELGPHGVTFKFSRGENGIWNVDIHDPNFHPNASNIENRKKLMKAGYEEYVKFIDEFTDQTGIQARMPPKEKMQALMSNPVIGGNEGSCDTISSIAGAAFILGKVFFSDLTRQCKGIGENCVEDITKILHPGIDKILTKMLNVIKDRFFGRTPAPDVKDAEATQTARRAGVGRDDL